MLAAPLVLLVTGCAVGNFIVGAPSGRERATHNALLARRCGGCHEIPDPQRMPAAEWQSALGRMRKRIELPAAEWDTLAAMARPE
jgi:hypothetical protein